MRRHLVLLALLSAVPAAPAAAATPDAIGQRVAAEVVHVESGAAERISVAQAGQLRLRIVSRALGRLKVAVVTRRSVRDAGGIQALAQGIDGGLGSPLRGALLVVAPGEAFVVTAYADSGSALKVVRSAFARGGGEFREIARSIDGLADADPGPEQDATAPGATETPGAPTIDLPDLDGVTEAAETGIRAVAIAIAAAILLPVLFVLGRLGLRIHRRRREAALDHADTIELVRADLVRLGDGVRELDLTTSMPGADAAGRAHYATALDHYDRANAMLIADEPDARAVRKARAAVDTGLAELAHARARLDAPPGLPTEV